AKARTTRPEGDHPACTSRFGFCPEWRPCPRRGRLGKPAETAAQPRTLGLREGGALSLEGYRRMTAVTHTAATSIGDCAENRRPRRAITRSSSHATRSD